MPTYEYACESCGRRYEKREGFDAPARQQCRFCGNTANRVLFAPPIVFKGSGFYKTDNRGTSSAADSARAPAASDDSPVRAPEGDARGHGAEPASGSPSKDAGATEAAAAG